MLDLGPVTSDRGSVTLDLGPAPSDLRPAMFDDGSGLVELPSEHNLLTCSDTQFDSALEHMSMQVLFLMKMNLKTGNKYLCTNLYVCMSGKFTLEILFCMHVKMFVIIVMLKYHVINWIFFGNYIL